MKKTSSILLLFAFCLLLQSGDNLGAENGLIGKKVSDFKLKDLNGEKIRLSKFRKGDRAILLIWTTWCASCRATIPDLTKNSTKFTEQGIKLLLINLGEPEADVRTYVQTNKIQLPVWLDKNSEMMDRFSIVHVPTFVLVDREGIIRGISNRLPENYEQLLGGV